MALASSNRLYTWGSSPQVLRLQAQAQKKARFQYHQQQIAAAAMAKEGREELTTDAETGTFESAELSDDAESAKSKTHFKMAPTSRFVTLNSEMVVSPSTEFKGLLTGRAAHETPSTVKNVSIFK